MHGGGGGGGGGGKPSSWPPFLRELLEGKGNAAVLDRWIAAHAPVSVKAKKVLVKAQRAVTAAMLYHAGLVELAAREAAVAVERDYEARDFTVVPPAYEPPPPTHTHCHRTLARHCAPPLLHRRTRTMHP